MHVRNFCFEILNILRNINSLCKFTEKHSEILVNVCEIRNNHERGICIEICIIKHFMQFFSIPKNACLISNFDMSAKIGPNSHCITNFKLAFPTYYKIYFIACVSCFSFAAMFHQRGQLFLRHPVVFPTYCNPQLLQLIK